MGIKYPHKKFIEFSIQRLPRVPTGPSAKLELSIANKCYLVLSSGIQCQTGEQLVLARQRLVPPTHHPASAAAICAGGCSRLVGNNFDIDLKTILYNIRNSEKAVLSLLLVESDRHPCLTVCSTGELSFPRALNNIILIPFNDVYSRLYTSPIWLELFNCYIDINQDKSRQLQMCKSMSKW